MNEQVTDFYARSGAMTFVGNYTAALKKLSGDVKDLTGIVQGLAIHEFVAFPFYGVQIPHERQDESHIRQAKQMLDRILALDEQPLTISRTPDKRLVGVCHHFAVLLVSLLRARGIPARSRYGFGDYFNPGYFEDHSLCEYWNAAEKRWVLVDPQFDEVWRVRARIKHDIFDVPSDHFLTAGDAWIKCRSGEADPATFGIFQGDLRGLWFIAGVLVRDIAALNKMEMLQWDTWGAMPRPGNKLQDKEKLTFFDRLAELTRNTDASFKELRRVYADKNNRLAVPERVFNAVRRHLEYV